LKLTGKKQAFFLVLLWFAVFSGWPRTAETQELVSETVHNLSASGPGRMRAPSESRVCVFCHAPHNTIGMRPLWNRELSVSSYKIYQSSTLDARTRQPTGASKFCLSCHDGTIALGSVVSQSDRIRMSGGDYIPSGLTNLGTDLSDDHPISFTYTTGLAASDRQLASPRELPKEIRLDASSELQCTSCHDAHDNMHGDFLVRDNRYGALCTACHRMNGWPSSTHRTSSVSMAGKRIGDWPHTTVAENACRCCHRSHTAGGHERLLIFEKEEDNCLVCHNGQVAATNILAELDKRSTHDPRRYLGRHDPMEVLGGDKAHVECADCHNPHAVAEQVDRSGYVPIGATLARVPGVTTSGSRVQEAKNEYEICLRCHGDSAVKVRRRIGRQSNTENLRLKFNTANPSFHPVATSAAAIDTVSLVPEMPSGTMIRCTDCHNNNNGPRTGGSGPRGPHGSIYSFLLERNYTVIDNTLESAYEYALCYKCHRRSSILNDESFKGHRLHIQEEKTPCSACHDPHGISRTGGGSFSDHTHLINFDTVIVRPEASTGRLEFRDLGRFTGSCTLTCHGKAHVNEEYR
jgi:predicted CXXCH cytochrome family protein